MTELEQQSYYALEKPTPWPNLKKLLKSPYADNIRERSAWLIDEFGAIGMARLTAVHLSGPRKDDAVVRFSAGPNVIAGDSIRGKAISFDA